MNKVLVTGGAGFIGSNLCRKLVNTCEVWSLDNYSAGTELNQIAGVTYISGHTADINKLVNFSPYCVYHLGEYSRPETSFDDIDTVWESNIKGTFNVINFCLKHGSKLIYAGSSTKFADNGEGKNQSPYALFKSVNTEIICNYGIWYNLSYAITYFYNVYGLNEIAAGKYATLIGIYRNKYICNEPLPVVSPGTQERNFTHIDDVIDGLVLVAQAGNGDNYGIGSDETYSVVDVAKMFSSEITIIPCRKGNRTMSSLNTSKTKLLGWEPKRNLKDYIAEFKSKYE